MSFVSASQSKFMSTYYYLLNVKALIGFFYQVWAFSINVKPYG